MLLILGPPLSNSYHNIIQMIPTFRSALKRSKTVSVWQDKYKEKLSGCSLSVNLATDWDVFYQDNNTDNITARYILFCVDTVVPKRTIGIYRNNNKNYITLKREKIALDGEKPSRTTMEPKAVQQELKRKPKEV